MFSAEEALLGPQQQTLGGDFFKSQGKQEVGWLQEKWPPRPGPVGVLGVHLTQGGTPICCTCLSLAQGCWTGHKLPGAVGPGRQSKVVAATGVSHGYEAKCTARPGRGPQDGKSNPWGCGLGANNGCYKGGPKWKGCS